MLGKISNFLCENSEQVKKGRRGKRGERGKEGGVVDKRENKKGNVGGLLIGLQREVRHSWLHAHTQR